MVFSQKIDKRDHLLIMLEQYLQWLWRWHKWLVIVSMIALVVLSLGILQLHISRDLRVYFSHDNTHIKNFEVLESIYHKQDTLVFLIDPQAGDNGIFSEKSLRLITELTEQAWKIPYSQRVTSLGNYLYTRATEDSLETRELISFDTDLSSARERQKIQTIALEEYELRHNLIAADAQVSVVIVNIALPENDSDTTAAQKTIDYAQMMLRHYKTTYPQINILLSGSTIFNHTMGEAVKDDIMHLAGLSYGLIIIGLFIFLRSLSGTVLIVTIIAASAMTTMGFFGYLGYHLSPVAGFIPTAVMTIAVADTIHILVTYYYEIQQGKDKQQALENAMYINAWPIFITSVTTMIGVLCLQFIDSPPYQDLGQMIAFGVFMAYLLAMSFLPAMLVWLPKPKRKAVLQWQKMDNFAQWIIYYQKQLFWGIIVLVVIFASQIGENKLTERWHEYFDKSFSVRQAVEIINNKLSGAHRVLYSIQSGEKEGISNPAYLQQIDQLSQWYRQQAGVVYVTSLVDIIKKLNQLLHDNDPKWYRVPDNKPLIAQILLLYEMSLPQGMGLDNIIAVDRSQILLAVTVKKTDSQQLLDLDQQAQHWWQQHSHFPAIQGTGMDIVFANMIYNIIQGLLQGVSVAFILISLLLMLALRSVKMGVISLIPNILPAMLAYGIWSIWKGYIDTSAAIVVCVALGLIVDDTVHFLTKYQYARKHQHCDAKAAIRYAFNTVGVALCITSIALVAGFMVMLLSHFTPSNVLGSLLSLTISIALFIDLFFLPPLLIRVDKYLSKTT